MKYGFFHGLIWTSYQKLWSGSMIIHHLRKGKGRSEACRGHISQPYQTFTQVIKSSARSRNCRACWSHSRERDVFLWKRRSLRTHWHWNSWHKFPWWMQRKKKVLQLSLPLLIFHSSMKIHQGPFNPCFSELKEDLNDVWINPPRGSYPVRRCRSRNNL